MNIVKLTADVIAFNAGDPRRAHHLLKVWAFCRTIARSEGLEGEALETLEAAALLHDIGIHEVERKYGSCSGHWQEVEGPVIAGPMLDRVGATQSQRERVLFLIAHHHTYQACDALDFRILIESGYLATAYEERLPLESCQSARDNLFETQTGIKFLEDLLLAPAYSPDK